MPLPPQNIRRAQANTQRTLIAIKERNTRRAAGIPIQVPDPIEPEKTWSYLGKADYWEITSPTGQVFKANKEDDIGQQIEDLVDDHMTWGNIFKLGLLGLGFAIFAGGIKMQREVQK